VTITLDDLRTLLTTEGVKYFISPDQPLLSMGFTGLTGQYQMVMSIDLDGRFLQFRTMGYLRCPADHAHLEAVLRVLGHLDYQLRLTKFGWDPADGEIVGYADLWLEDATLGQAQFSAMLHCFLSGIDLNHGRIEKTIETGTDPGPVEPGDVLAAAASRLPPELREAVEKLGKKAEDEKEKDEEKEEDEKEPDQPERSFPKL
jgi:hypothetical protein